MAELTSFVSAVAVILVLYIFARWIKRIRKRYPPGPWGFPVLGHLPLLGNDPTETYLEWWKVYGDVVRIRFGSWNCVVINGYDVIKDASERQDDVFSGRPDFVTLVALREAFQGMESISFTNFSSKYLQVRKLTATALKNYKNSCDYLPQDLFLDEAEKLTEKLLNHEGDEPVSVATDIEYTVESMVYQMLYGKGKESEIEPHVKEIVEASATFTKFASAGNIADVVPWLRHIMKGRVDEFKKAALATDWITRAKIKEHKESYEKGQTRDILDALCASSLDLPANETEDSISSQSLMFQATAVQGAGFDTTSRTLQCCILYMAAYPVIQQTVQQEIDDVLGHSKTVTLEDRANLPYVNATIQEVMRKTTIVPFAIPHLTLADTKLQGYDIDAGTVVFFNLHSVANEVRVWGDPEHFRPERLLDPEGKLDSGLCSHIMPFGAGRRRCVGEVLARMNIFITFTTLLQRCSFSKAEGHGIDLEPASHANPTPKPCKIAVQRRF